MIDIENNIIGNVLKTFVDPTTLDLQEKHFSCSYGRGIWNAIEYHVARKITPDLITIADYLEKNHPDKVIESWSWIGHLGLMAKESLPKSTVESHAKAMRTNWKVREVKNIGAEMANNDDADINKYIKDLMALNVTDKKYLHTFAEASDDALIEVEKVMAGESVTIPTGLSDIDKVMGGLHKSDLIIVAARSAMGKTAFLLNMAAANKTGPLVISGEQSRIQAAFRLFSIYGNVPNHLIRTGDIGNEEFGKISMAISKITESGGYIYDKSGPTISEVEAVARQVYQDSSCTAIYIDYLQKIKHENPNLPPHQAIGEITMRLKDLARELDIPVVALAQVNRSVEKRDDKRPGMGDIKDSGTIEQEADSILTLYRDEVYNEDTPDRGTCEVNFKKNRHGGTGMVRVKWTAPTMRFNDLSDRSV
jgi:replicative DNA helicase